MKLTTKQLVQTALLLTICIISQLFKNLSVYLTGPIINAVIIIAVLAVGLFSGLLISMITPITAFFITGSPIMAAIPLMFPVIMLGNCILALTVWYFNSKLSFSLRLPLGLLIGSTCKAIFLGCLTAFVLLPIFGGNIASKLPNPAAVDMVIATAKTTFSITQFITAIIGSAVAYLIWIPLKKYLKNQDISQ